MTRGPPRTMLEFRTLGALALKDPDGQDVESVLTQPKQLALLAYLAAAQPRGFHRRDKLLGLLWPELDDRHARSALSQAVYRLRNALGDVALASRGHEELALDEERVVCDTATFERALDAAEPERALRIYRGNFLEGFFLSGAGEFERWLEGERTRLRELAAGGAWDIAEATRAGGDPIAASKAARRAAAFSPLDENVLRRLVSFLDGIGDRSGAIRAYDEFASHLAREYQLEPSPESETLIESVRARGIPNAEGGRTLDSAHRSPPPEHPDQVPAPLDTVVQTRIPVGRWALVVGAIGVATAGAVWNISRSSTAPPDVVRSVTIDIPEPAWHGSYFGQPLALSPDASLLAYVSYPTGPLHGKALNLRPLSEASAVRVEFEGDAKIPFFSPDGEWLGFFGADQLLKVPASGGPPTVVAELDEPVFGASWGPDNVIVFSHRSGLFSVPADGGVPIRVTTVDSAAGETAHLFPHVLPGGRRVLFNVVVDARLRIAILQLGTGQSRLLEELGDGIAPRHVSTGHVVYGRKAELWAAPFDLTAQRVTGAPIAVQDGLAHPFVDRGDSWSLPLFALSNSGTLAYVAGNPMDRSNRLVIVDTAGTERTVQAAQRGFYTYPRFSPDGRRIAVTLQPANEDSRGTWVIDLEASSMTRLTEHDFDVYPAWTPDGTYVTSASMQSEKWVISSMRGDGAAEPIALVEDEAELRALSWSPDGRYLAYTRFREVGGRDIWLYRSDDGTTSPLVVTEFHERSPMLATRGRWFAYVSDISGRDEVYVQRYLGPGEALMITLGGGGEPIWSADGSALYYRKNEQLLVVEVELGDTFTHGVPRIVLEGRFELANQGRPNYDVSPDGRSFVMVRTEGPENVPREGFGQHSPLTTLHLVTNWKQRLAEVFASRDSG